MTTYARTDETGQPVEIIEVEGDPAEIYTPEFIAALIPWTTGQELPEYEFPEPPAPVSVSMRQARLALLAAGLLDDVEAAVAGMEDRAAQIEWEFATTVERESGFVQQLASALGLDGEQLDSLFKMAVTL